MTRAAPHTVKEEATPLFLSCRCYLLTQWLESKQAAEETAACFYLFRFLTQRAQSTELEVVKFFFESCGVVAGPEAGKSKRRLRGSRQQARDDIPSSQSASLWWW